MDLQVIGEVVDAFGQQGDLDFRRPRVGVVKPVVVAMDTAWNRPVTMVSPGESNTWWRNRPKITSAAMPRRITK